MPKPSSGSARTVRASALLGVSLALAPPAPAMAQIRRLTVIGAGAGVSCAEWLAAGRSDPELEQWAFGFASAVAAGAQLRRGDDPLANLDADAIHPWLADRCRGHPDEALSIALARTGGVVAEAQRVRGARWKSTPNNRAASASRLDA